MGRPCWITLLGLMKSLEYCERVGRRVRVREGGDVEAEGGMTRGEGP